MSIEVAARKQEASEQGGTRQAVRQLAILGEYRARIERELRERCADMLSLIDRNLVPLAGSTEAKIFYYKLYLSIFHFVSSFLARKL